MLQIQGLRKAFGTQVLLEEASCLINPGERVGMIGANGHGKSTLIKMILGTESLDEGSISVPGTWRIGHLSQHLDFVADTVLEEACSALPPNEDGYIETHLAEAMLMGLGFGEERFTQGPKELSGGYQVRLNLAKALLGQPDLLLLDEPNNYLDIVSLRWLQGFLRTWRHTLILITHDREFMDSVTSHTLAVHRRGLRKFEGGTEKAYEQIAIEEEQHEKTRINTEKKIAQEMRFVERFRAKARRASQVQSRLKQIDKRERLDKLDEIRRLDFQFATADFNGKWLLETRDLAFGYNKDPDLFENLDVVVGPRDRVGVIGPNGKGKSTLLKLMAGDLTPREGTVRQHVNHKIAHFGQDHIDQLPASRTIEEEVYSANSMLTRTEVRDICGLMMFSGDDAVKQIGVLSGGERARVLLARLLATPANLLLLDEPTNHLDITSTEALIDAISFFAGGVLLVTHAESVLRQVCNRLIVFDGGRAFVHESDYDDFLGRIGWVDEQSAAGSGPRATRSKRGSKKDLRRERAAIISERSRVLRPLLKIIDRSEKEIVEIEEASANLEAEMIEASEKGDASRIASLGADLKEKRRRIETLFGQLEDATREHDYASADFERRLDETDPDS